jgi:hypothetical protein
MPEAGRPSVFNTVPWTVLAVFNVIEPENAWLSCALAETVSSDKVNNVAREARRCIQAACPLNHEVRVR